MDVVCLDFSKAFDNIYQSILQGKLSAHVLDVCAGKKLAGWLGRDSGGEGSYIQLTSVLPRAQYLGQSFLISINIWLIVTKSQTILDRVYVKYNRCS